MRTSPLPSDKQRGSASGEEKPDKVEWVRVIDIVDEDDKPIELIDEEVELLDEDEQKSDEPQAEAPAPRRPRLPVRQIVLIGAGHAHLQILKWWRERPIRNAKLTLISAFGQIAYSGMLPSTLAGIYQPEEMMIDLPKLCERSRVELIVDRANRFDPKHRIIEFAHQPAMKFDVASINIGSVPASEKLWQSHRVLISVKPLPSFLQRFDVRFRELVEQWRMAPGPELLQIVVVGAGAAGVELALCLEQHKHELELPADVRIVDANSSILREFAPRTVRRVERLLKLRGIDLSLGSPVDAFDDEGPPTLILQNGERIRSDLVIWAAGASPPMALTGFDLPKSPRGFLSMKSTLQSTADVPVFIAGDAGDLEAHEIPKAGVYAVRQAPVLWRNLQNYLDDRPLVEYQPQKGFLRLLSCGDRTAILDYRGFTSQSSWAWWLKDWIDRSWVKQFQVS